MYWNGNRDGVLPGTIVVLRLDWIHTKEKCGYLQMRKRRQVTEGAFGNAGNIVAVEGPEAEAQVRR